MFHIGSSRPFSHVRIYRNPVEGFDIYLRERMGLTLHGSRPSIEEALREAHALNGTAIGEPVFVYLEDLDTMLQLHAWERLALNPPRHAATNIGE